MFNQYFGSYLLEKKIISPDQLREVLAEQNSAKVKLGVLAIDSGYMTAAQVETIHKLQATKDRKFGELAVEAGFLTEDQLMQLLGAQKKSNVLLGQILIEKGFFTFEKYEEVLMQYKLDSGLSAEEIQSLKDNDVEKISEIFLKSLPQEQNDLIREYFELFVRNLIRFIDSEIRLKEAKVKDSYEFDYLVTQKIEKGYRLFSGFAGTEDVLARFASIYAEEELDGMNVLAKDALAEFLNCHNGLFLSHLSHKGIEADLVPGEVKDHGVLKPVGKVYVIPCYLSFGKINFVFAAENPDFE